MLILGWIVIALIAGCGFWLFYAAYRAAFIGDRYEREVGFGVFLAGCGIATMVLVAFCVLWITDDSPRYSLLQRDWACTASHVETRLRSQLVGRTTILVPYTTHVCDQYTRR